MAGPVFHTAIGFRFSNPVSFNPAILKPTNQLFTNQCRGYFQNIAKEKPGRKKPPPPLRKRG
jgi:hypothetical protein